MSVVNPTAPSYSGAAACAESFLNPNAGTRNAEKTKTDKYRLLCESAAWYGLCTDHPHDEWGDGGAVPAAILESARIRVAEEGGSHGRGRHFGRPDSRSQLRTVMLA